LFVNRGRARSRTLPPALQVLSEEALRRRNYPSFVDPTGQNAATNTTKASVNGTQITESDGNFWPPPKGAGFEDRGSEFYTQKREILYGDKLPFVELFPKNAPYGESDTSPTSFLYRLRYTPAANFLACFDDSTYLQRPVVPFVPDWPTDSSSSKSQLNAKGAIAVSNCAPGNAIAQAATAIGELMQDVPKVPGAHLWESRLRALGTVALAGEFLNYQFGIAPTIGDMGDFLKAVHKVDRLVDQFIRDSGRVVRRSFHFPKESTTTESVIPNRISPAGYWSLTNNPSLKGMWGMANRGSAIPWHSTIRRRTVEQETWFSGAFTYHMPRGYDNHSKGDRRRLMAQFFGAKPDLETLWNLAPWSWAADWFVDVGSLIKNLQNKINYGTIMPYGYVMQKTVVTDTFMAGKVRNFSYPGAIPAPYPPVPNVTLRVTTKKRVQANPFGFGVTWDGLSPTQAAIAAALGITRVVR